MKIMSNAKKEQNTVELVIQVGAAEFEAAQQKVYLKNRGNIQVPGFRKGRVPRKMIENMYGVAVFYEDAIDELYPVAYEEAVKEAKLDPVAPPVVEVTEAGKDGFTFSALVTLMPEYKLGEYKGLTAPKTEEKVTDKDIEAELAPFVQRATRLVAVTRKAKKGDTTIINFEGFVDGVAFDGGKGENHPLELGSDAFIPGFEDGLIGVKSGEEKDVPVTFPTEYAAELAGKDAIFKVQVLEVKEPKKPTVDDEFAKDVSEFDTLEAFKASLSEKLVASRAATAEQDFEEALMDALLENLEVELPQTLIEHRGNEVLREYAARFESQGLPFQQYLQMTGQTLEAMQAQSQEAATHQMKYEMALEGVAKAEKLKVTAAERKAEYKALAEQYKMDLEKVEAVAVEDEINKILLRRKALKVVKENATVGKAPAKKAAAKTTEDKKPAAKKATATKSDADKKPAAKKATATKADGEKKPAAKKTTAKKTAE